MKIKKWKLRINGNNEHINDKIEIPANVPGDITVDLYRAGLIADPYFGLNHEKLGWIIKSDFEYRATFDLPSDIFCEEEILLEFDSIDTFAEIGLNGKFLGSTENMFLKYVFSVKDAVKKVGNELIVKMRSTVEKMNAADDAGYFGVFNTKRLFIRKAQCHFGWDWAPDMPGYGICGAVNIIGVKKNRIETTAYKSFNDGFLTLYADLNYTIHPRMDSLGNTVKVENQDRVNDVLRYTVSLEPNKPIENAEVEVKESKIARIKNFKNFKVKNPQLWYPANYGEQPLYEYKIQLIHDGKVTDERKGKFAFREVKLIQKPTGDDTMGYKFEINGREIFIKGSNWVPTECFTGLCSDEKYEKLIKKAVDANFNMLRVWGGGIYENDVFYDLCDKCGIMVWQDMMFACADIPEDDKNFVENVKKEITYQIKRLRNHPSIVYWCGGNEKTGSYGLQICRGDYFVDVILRGLITDLDDTRPYARQSPCSLTDVGNDRQSGESHAGSYECSLVTGVDKYRENVSKSLVPFVSECAVMGADTEELYKRIFPEDKLWDMNEYWDDRLMDNPYSAVAMIFSKRQKFYAEGLYGKCTGLRDFIAKSMTSHAETMRAEIEFARACGKECGGFMSWMYSDIWPSATWAAIGYYLEPKHVYYQMKRSFEKTLATFVFKDGKTKVVVINEGYKSINAHFEYGLKTLRGEVLWRKTIETEISACGEIEDDVSEKIDVKNTYLYIDGVFGGKKKKNVWSANMWKNCGFESDYEYSAAKTPEGLKVKIKANAFAKGVVLKFPENYKYDFSDNYFDLEAGEEKIVTIEGGADENELVVTDFAKETSI